MFSLNPGGTHRFPLALKRKRGAGLTLFLWCGSATVCWGWRCPLWLPPSRCRDGALLFKSKVKHRRLLGSGELLRAFPLRGARAGGSTSRVCRERLPGSCPAVTRARRKVLAPWMRCGVSRGGARCSPLRPQAQRSGLPDASCGFWGGFFFCMLNKHRLLVPGMQPGRAWQSS